MKIVTRRLAYVPHVNTALVNANPHPMVVTVAGSLHLIQTPKAVREM